MRLLAQRDWSPRSLGSETAGWEIADEIDMQPDSNGGTCKNLKGIRDGLPADRRLRYNNYGKGVIFWDTDAEAACYVKSVDVPSTDVYWFNDSDSCSRWQGGKLLFPNAPRALTGSECHRASNYGAQTRQVRKLANYSVPSGRSSRSGPPSPIWAPESPPLRSGRQSGTQSSPGREIIYFNHSFGGTCQTQHALREPCYTTHRKMVKSVNGQIASLAPVLNAPFVTSGWSHNAATKAMVKWRGGHFYFFAGSSDNASSTGSFSIPCVGNATARSSARIALFPSEQGRSPTPSLTATPSTSTGSTAGRSAGWRNGRRPAVTLSTSDGRSVGHGAKGDVRLRQSEKTLPPNLAVGKEFFHLGMREQAEFVDKVAYVAATRPEDPSVNREVSAEALLPGSRQPVNNWREPMRLEGKPRAGVCSHTPLPTRRTS